MTYDQPSDLGCSHVNQWFDGRLWICLRCVINWLWKITVIEIRPKTLLSLPVVPFGERSPALSIKVIQLILQMTSEQLCEMLARLFQDSTPHGNKMTKLTG